MKKQILIFILLLLSWEGMASTTRKWTVMIYWAVDNDLYEFSKPYLHQFEQLPDSEDVSIVLEYDYPDERGTERFQVRHSSLTFDPSHELRNSILLEQTAERNSADPAVLKDFIKMGMTKFPAENYLLIIGSHGSNWSGLIEDETSKRYMTLAGFQSALSEKMLDLLVFDTCRMSFLETLMNLKGHTRYFAATPFDLNGFDHISPLKQLIENADLSPQQLGENYVKAYPLKPENAGTENMSASLLDPSNSDMLILDFEKFVSLILEKRELQLLKENVSLTITEDNDWAIDFFDFIKQAGNLYSDLKMNADLLLMKYNKVPVLFHAGTEFTNHSGLSLTCAKKLNDYQSTTAGEALSRWSDLCRIWRSDK